MLSTTSRAALLAALLSATPALADNLRGQVTASGGAPIQGAIVTVEDLNREAVSDRFGNYRINNLPAGTYTVSVRYLGADNTTQSVTLGADGTVLDLNVGDETDYLDNIIVVGTRAAQAGALNQQRAADTILSVIDSDGLGNFPDTTVADSLSRVPGLSIETDQGEGRYVSIRGINTDLISASINGVRTPSPEDRRGVLLDGVPSDLLDGIEVQKSLTPDVDGDSLGGVINLKTISAFDREGQFIRLKAEGRWNEIAETISPKITGTYSNVFNDRIGVALSLNYQDLDIVAHNNEAGEFDFLDDGTAYLNDDFENRFYDLTRERFGAVANFDLRASEATTLYLRTLYNNYQDDEIRNKFELRDLDDVEDDGTITPTSIILPLNEVDAEVRVRKETRNIITAAAGGETVTGPWSFDYEVSYAFADEQDDDNHDVTFRFEDIQDTAPGLVGLDYSNPETPILGGTQSVLDAIYDESNYQLDELEREFSVNEDTEYAARFNIARDSLLMDTPVEWKAGVKYRDRNKVRDENFLFFEPDFNLSQFSNGGLIEDWRLGTPQPTWPDPELTRSLRNGTDTAGGPDSNADDSFFESNITDYDIDERILAFYGMGTFDIDALTVIAGVRVEQTDTTLRGNIVTEGDTTITEREVDNDYTDVLPSVNAKYGFSDRLIGRAAYYKAIVRPSFGEMAPSIAFNDDRDEVEFGNPDLDPYSADNFDLALEFYPSNLSVISVGAFYKDIGDAIFPASFDIDEVPASVDLSVFSAEQVALLNDVNTFINVGDTEVLGVEFNLVQDMADISEALDGFIVSANLTLTDSESVLPDGREVPFLKQSDTVWNAAIGYDKGPWDLRISANYRGDYLDGLVDENLDRFTDDRLLIEASAKYRFSELVQVYVEGKNLTDAPEYYYFGDESRLSQYDEFGTSVIAGVRLTWR